MTVFESATILSLLVIFAATVARSTVGFGEALIAMPLLALTVGLEIAKPWIALLSVCIAASILARDWREVQIRSALVLVASAVVGVPVGVFALDDLAEKYVNLGLAAVIILFAVYRLTNPSSWRLKSERLAVVFGFLGGLLGGAYNVTGPALVMYGSLRQWNAQQFRATLQGVFLPTSILIAVLRGARGTLTRDVWFLWALSLPVMVLAIACGRWLNRRVDSHRFANLIYYLLIGIGIVLIGRSLAAE